MKTGVKLKEEQKKKVDLKRKKKGGKEYGGMNERRERINGNVSM